MTAHSFVLDIKIYKHFGYVYSLSGHGVECERGMHPCSKAGQWPSGLHQAEYCQQVKGVNLSPLLSAGETHLECCIQFWSSSRKTWIYWKEFSQGPQSLLRTWSICYLRRGGQRGNSSARRKEASGGSYVYKNIFGGIKEVGVRLFSVVSSDRIRDNEHNLKYRKIHLNIKLFFFFFNLKVNMIKNLLPKEVCQWL